MGQSLTLAPSPSEIIDHYPKNLFLAKYETNVDNDIDKRKVYNFNNISTLEKQLPDELLSLILSYLDNIEYTKLKQVSRNFRNYWIRLNWKERDSSEYGSFIWFKPIPKNSPSEYFTHFHSTFLPFLNRNIKYTTESGKLLKFLIMGPKSCGKSCFVDRLIIPNSKFKTKIEPTISSEVEFVRFSALNETFSIQLWDCSGEWIYQGIISSQIPSSNVIVYCFDLSSKESFESLRMKYLPFFLSKLNENSIMDWLSKKNITFLIIGLKKELKRQVSTEMIEELMRELTPNDEIYSKGIPLLQCRVNYFELGSAEDSYSQVILPLQYALLRHSILGQVLHN
ncbi:rab family member [Naegleria gruberi]|uniref:Rab family member n=1 Tax=Naegleria gruberi TaxID=5762 RepID=D2VFA9_NAEGR|nr:rab family member [Naegleria gruberi]EFC44428.1 rab family member [Naegleria gruberi]|eukprot:XP_002677172.1 rab family member [Naegleria gruberi strain NEG-M]